MQIVQALTFEALIVRINLNYLREDFVMTFENRVQRHLLALSSGQKKAADYILQNLEYFSYATLAKLSKEIGVSETTIIRLAYSLEFDSFSQMQSAIRRQLLHAAETGSQDNPTDSNFYVEFLNREIQAIQTMAARLNCEMLDQICKILYEADMVLSIGARSSYYAADWFGSHLYLMRPNVHTIQQFYDSRLDLIKELTSSSVVLAISMARYAKWTYTYGKLAKEQGAIIVVVTDSLASPLIELADYTLLTESNRNDLGSNSLAPLFCVLNAILARFQASDQENIARRMSFNEALNKHFDYYFE